MKLLILLGASLLIAAGCGVPQTSPVREGALLAMPAPALAPLQQEQPAPPQALAPRPPIQRVPAVAAPGAAPAAVAAGSGCTAGGKPPRGCPPP